MIFEHYTNMRLNSSSPKKCDSLADLKLFNLSTYVAFISKITEKKDRGNIME